MVPLLLPVHTMKLDLYRNHISELKVTDFRNVSNLRALNVSYNYISKVNDGTFQELIHLRELYMNRNRLKHVTGGFLQGLVSLTVLRLDLNEIEDIEQSAFDSLSNLKHVNLASNRLTLMESVKTILQLPNLFELNIENNKITNFVSHSLPNTPLQLQRLSLFSNPLKTFHIANNIFPYLSYLDISNCSYNGSFRWIVEDPSFLGSVDTLNVRLNHLTALKVRNTKITELNNITHVLPSVSMLDFSNNNIERITCSDFSNLTLLENLYLYHNKIYMIRNCTFQNLPNLRVLLLGSNKLLDVGHIFNGDLPNLSVLDLHSNKISQLDARAFSGLPALKILQLYDNQINSISKNTFDGLHNLRELHLNANHLQQNTFTNPGIFKGMPHLELLNLNENVITFDSQNLKAPPFTELKSLQFMFISNQRLGMNNLPCNLLRGLSSLILFHGSHLDIHYVHPETFTYTPELRYLHLSNNVFMTEISPRVFHPVATLSELHITHSLLPSLNFLIDANLSQLRNLQVQDNQIQGINQTIIQSLPNLEYIDLRYNPFICDCSNEWLLHWANQSKLTQVVYFNQYHCSYPSALKREHLEDLNTDSCSQNLEFIYFAGSFSLVIVTLLVSFIYNFMRFQLVYAYYLFLAYLYDSMGQRKQKQHGFLYDAFISYNSQDERWVHRELLPNLETEQGWRLCLHHRDFEPGKPIIDNIVEGIYSSRKTICVVTRDYLGSEWCSREIQVASFRLFDEKKDVLILVFLEDIPAQHLSPYHRMRKLVKNQTYLCWPKPGEDRIIFWQKLRLAISTNKEENPFLLGGE
ncbi:toll-like receptor 13 [Engraulis encrasicolus]|uniref:toll-like receptor 13 n=1 Tax=Engraulis encrasicolus TaxID=184585 RepID=UPI002FD1CD3D